MIVQIKKKMREGRLMMQDLVCFQISKTKSTQRTCRLRELIKSPQLIQQQLIRSNYNIREAKKLHQINKKKLIELRQKGVGFNKINLVFLLILKQALWEAKVLSSSTMMNEGLS